MRKPTNLSLLHCYTITKQHQLHLEAKLKRKLRKRSGEQVISMPSTQAWRSSQKSKAEAETVTPL